MAAPQPALTNRMYRRRDQLISREAVVRLSALIAFLCLLVVGTYWVMIAMPGRSFEGPLPALSAQQTELRDRLRAGVQKLAGAIGERNVDRYEELRSAADWLEGSFRGAGYSVERQTYAVLDKRFDNLVVERTGNDAPKEIVVIGAHYDTASGSPGANDNATGAIAVLELARVFAARATPRTIRFVEFVNEEPPSYQGEGMGSRVYAKRCRDRSERIVGMVSIETVGYFSREPGSQSYPIPALGFIYPKTGDFISFVGNVDSRELVRRAVGAFRGYASFPSEGGAFPANLPGVGWSDHSSFWAVGYPAIMITDTAPFRYPHYHEASDTPDKVDYDALARVVDGLEGVVEGLAASGS
jgi:Zn-dependent M28 family amino/carboxypeptidase